MLIEKLTIEEINKALSAILQEIAQLKGVSTDVVIDTIDSNVKSKFDLN